MYKKIRSTQCAVILGMEIDGWMKAKKTHQHSMQSMRLAPLPFQLYKRV
jgi:hypothetical protein